MIEALSQGFVMRALLAGLGLALIAAPLGCIVVWRRMAYFGETITQSSLIGVALALLFSLDMTSTVLIVVLGVAGLLIAISRTQAIPLDSVLGLVAHAALAIGVIAASLVRGRQVDLMGYLFGDIFAVSSSDLVWIWGGGGLVMGCVLYLWRPLLAIAVHEELAAAEGTDIALVKAAFIILLAVTIAVVMKVVGVLLTIAFLIMPGSAARPLASTPEGMALMAAIIGTLGVFGGVILSVAFDTPGGPSIVVVLSAVFAVTATWSVLGRARA